MAYTTIPKSTDYFNTSLWTGNDTAQTITGIPFAPDFVWIKNRSTAESHTLVNTVIGANNFLKSNATSANNTNTEFVKSFTSDGYTLGNADEVNNGSNNIVGWNWKANGAGASNTAGSINTTKTSANTTSGCSIITYTGNGSAGATIGHGMGIKPSMIIIKNSSIIQDWIVYTQSLTATKILYLNQTGGFNDNNVFFNDTEPTTSLITLGSNSSVNGSGNSHVAYCFADVQGYSKQNSYVGNGNVNGTFNYTGFKPAFVMIKNYADSGGASNNGGNWRIFDNQRLGYNVNNATLYPNLSNSEADETSLDLLSNGFKMRGTTGDLNENGMKYVYMAFAAEPLVSTNGNAATAR